MTEKRFEEVYGEMGLFRVKDNKTGKYYKAVLCGNPFTETDKPILDVLNEIAEENEQLKSEIKDLNDALARYEEKYIEIDSVDTLAKLMGIEKGDERL